MIQAAFLLQDHRRFSPAAARGQRGRLCCVSKSEIYFVRSSRSLGTGVIVLQHRRIIETCIGVLDVVISQFALLHHSLGTGNVTLNGGGVQWASSAENAVTPPPSTNTNAVTASSWRFMAGDQRAGSVRAAHCTASARTSRPTSQRAAGRVAWNTVRSVEV